MILYISLGLRRNFETGRIKYCRAVCPLPPPPPSLLLARRTKTHQSPLGPPALHTYVYTYIHTYKYCFGPKTRPAPDRMIGVIGPVVFSLPFLCRIVTIHCKHSKMNYVREPRPFGRYVQKYTKSTYNSERLLKQIMPIKIAQRIRKRLQTGGYF